jgi:alpha-tubulin suppressor-like RCC1 family protein
VTGLTNGNTYTAKVLAVNSYGPSAFSAPSGGVVPVAPFNLFTWGINSQGQLGLGDGYGTNRSSPVQVGALTDWSQTSGGFNFCAAIKANATLWSWGQNNQGQLGLNDVADRSSPVQVGALTDWNQISAGRYHCAAVKTNGTLWTWGYGSFGRLGHNNTVNRSSPVQVGALTDWSQVSAGNQFCAAIKTNGTLWTWGNNEYGQLGQNTSYSLSRSSPVQVGALTDWSQIATGLWFCAAIKTNGTLWTWGRNITGNLGQNISFTINRSSPVQVGALTDWLQVSTGQNFCAAIKTNGSLWSWGNNTAGELGLNDVAYRSSPVQVGALTDWSQVSGGAAFCAAIKTNATLWSWGYNGSGQLGQGNVIRRSSPVQVGSLTSWSSVGQGFNRGFSVAIRN